MGSHSEDSLDTTIQHVQTGHCLRLGCCLASQLRTQLKLLLQRKHSTPCSSMPRPVASLPNRLLRSPTASSLTSRLLPPPWPSSSPLSLTPRPEVCPPSKPPLQFMRSLPQLPSPLQLLLPSPTLDTPTASTPSTSSEPTQATATLLVCPTLPTHMLVSQSLLLQLPRLKSQPSYHLMSYKKSNNDLNLF